MNSAGANSGFVQQQGGTSAIAVPTADPFLRKKRKVLNPGSCSSAMNLLALAHAGSIGSMQSFHRAMTTALNPSSRASGPVPTADPFLRKRKLDEEGQRTRKVLNPGSCASAMDLLALAHAGSIGSMQSLHHMMTTVLNPNSGASGHDLSNGLQGRGSRRGSMASVSSAVSDASQFLRAIQGNVSQSSLVSASANGFALLLGSSSSSRGRGSSKNNARLCRRANDQASDGNRNADWDVFE